MTATIFSHTQIATQSIVPSHRTLPTHRGQRQASSGDTKSQDLPARRRQIHTREFSTAKRHCGTGTTNTTAVHRRLDAKACDGIQNRDAHALRSDPLPLSYENMAKFMRDTESSRSRARKEVSPSRSRTSASQTSKSSTKARVRDADFRCKVLLPRGITIPAAIEQSDPFAHFGTPKPDDRAQYHTLECDTAVWLNLTDEAKKQVSLEYHCMQHDRLCEAEFASFAREHLLRRDRRSLEYRETRAWRTERMIELVARPAASDSSKWRPPPAIATANAPEYSFDIRPDCQYWLSISSFNPEYTRLFGRYVYVHQRRITCPYLTVEFKRDESTLELAQNQVAVAAAVALYNRSLLKLGRLRATGKKWTKKHRRGVTALRTHPARRVIYVLVYRAQEGR